jgi:hypothetical protein
MAMRRNAGRRVIALDEAQAIAAKAGLHPPAPATVPCVGVNRQTGDKYYPVSGGYAYPRITAGTFGGKFTLDQKASAFTVNDDPLLVPDGKFYIVKVAPDDPIQPVPDEDEQINGAGIMAIYQVCVHHR